MFQANAYLELPYFDMAPVPLLLLNERGEIIHSNRESVLLFHVKPLHSTLDDCLSQSVWQSISDHFVSSSQKMDPHPFKKIIHLKNSDQKYLIKISLNVSRPAKIFVVAFIPYQREPHIDFTLLESLPVSMAIVDGSGHFLKMNQAFCRLLGYQSDELLDMKDEQVTYLPDTEKESALRRDTILKSSSGYQLDKRYLNKEGERVWVRTFVSLIAEVSSSATFLIAAFDIHQEKQFQELIVTSESRFRTMAENVRCVVWMSAFDPMSLLYVNRCYGDVWEEPVASLYCDARAFLNKIHASEKERVIQTRFSSSTEPWSINYRLNFEDGRIKHIRDTGHCVFDGKGALMYRVGTLTDITAEIQQCDQMTVMAKKLRKLVDFDTLTGIKSRRAIMTDIDDAFQHYTLSGETSVLVYIDADEFKLINDSYGHEIGDQVLRMISEHLERNIRESDVVGRMGGDEFVILLRQTSLADIPPVLDRISGKIEGSTLPDDLVVSVSLGAIELSSSIYTPDHWLSEADKTMYQNKRVRRKRMTAI